MIGPYCFKRTLGKGAEGVVKLAINTQVLSPNRLKSSLGSQANRAGFVQGYLCHKKQRPPRALQ